MSKRTSSTDPSLRVVDADAPVTKKDLADHERKEESFVAKALRDVLRWRLTIVGALALLAAPAAVAVKGVAWADDRYAKADAGEAVKARVERLEQTAAELKAELAAQRVEVRAAKEAAQGTREDLRLLFPRLPALPADGGP